MQLETTGCTKYLLISQVTDNFFDGSLVRGNFIIVIFLVKALTFNLKLIKLILQNTK